MLPFLLSLLPSKGDENVMHILCESYNSDTGDSVSSAVGSYIFGTVSFSSLRNAEWVLWKPWNPVQVVFFLRSKNYFKLWLLFKL